MTALTAPSPALVQSFAGIVGEANAVRDPADQAPYLTEWRDLYHGRTPAVLFPATADEISRILALANAERVGIVPQGGNTGLVGGQIPSPLGTEIVVNLRRMNRVRGFDPAGNVLTVEAGMTLAAVQQEAERHDRLFPLSLASEGSCCIGGNLATNAGGVGVLAYGNTRALTLGVEAVLADGRVWNGLSTLEKDNTGYDLKDLLVGSEGTLGIITAAALKVFPRPREMATAIVALPTLQCALTLLEQAKSRTGRSLTAYEFMSALALDFALRHIPGTRAPFAGSYPWYALIEISGFGSAGEASRQLGDILETALGEGVASDAVIASSITQARALWRLRESLSEAQKPEGGSIKHDISVPIGAIPEFLRRADQAVEKIAPGSRPVPFGHLGDGNIHYNVSQPVGADKARFIALWEPMSRAVHDIAVDLGGSISAEHGIGLLKREELKRVKSAVDLDMKRRIKAALDPNGILNPGKLV